MGLFESITKNANKVINSENTIQTKRKLIKNGRTGLIVFFILAAVLTTVGVLMLVYSNYEDGLIAGGIVILVAALICFILFIICLFMLLVGIGMAVGGFGAKILDTTYTCPYCQTELLAKDNKCPSCGKPKGE